MDEATTTSESEREIAALLAEIPAELRATFEAYYQKRLSAALADAPTDGLLGAADPYACEAEVLTALMREADGRESRDGLGDLPLESQVVSIPIPKDDPRKAAALRSVDTPGPARQMSQTQRLLIGVLVVIGLVPLWQLGAILLAPNPDAVADAATTPTATVAEGRVTTPVAPTAAPLRADIPPASETAYWYPTSLELPSEPATVLRVVAAPSTLGGTWEPPLEAGTAAWLEGTFVNSIFCVPPAMRPALAALRSGQTLTLRTANGGMRRYQIDHILTVQRQQTEILTQRQARLTVLACGTDGADRTVAQASFLAEAGDSGLPAPTTTP
ncbi:MAG TPA: hypothetical protein VFS21_33980 [Roseiflexaceae bacterium]|nr:hypothetical protein [Roseiflexaceae bacterium]